MILKNNKNLRVIVDKDIDKTLKNCSWCICYRRKIPYVYTGIWNKKTKHTDIFALHRLIMNAKKGQVVDHINGNTLDNRKSNLRIATNAENCRNSKINKNSKTGFKGVLIAKNKTNPFSARIMFNRKNIHLGYFKTAILAAEAYDQAARKYFKEFAYFNFPKRLK